MRPPEFQLDMPYGGLQRHWLDHLKLFQITHYLKKPI
jgi:hypothetical protein